VAYSVLPADCQRSERAGFRRQVWWLADRDLNDPAYQGAGWPAEAVDPMRLVAGQ
jgi:hypothetical protein